MQGLDYAMLRPSPGRTANLKGEKRTQKNMKTLMYRLMAVHPWCIERLTELLILALLRW